MVGSLVGRKRKPPTNIILIKGLSILNGGARIEIPRTVSVIITENGLFTAYYFHFSVIHSGPFFSFSTFSLKINALRVLNKFIEKREQGTIKEYVMWRSLDPTYNTN